jgi:hypothetical protein
MPRTTVDALRFPLPVNRGTARESIDKVAAMTVGFRRNSGGVHYRPGARG